MRAFQMKAGLRISLLLMVCFGTKLPPKSLNKLLIATTMTASTASFAQVLAPLNIAK